MLDPHDTLDKTINQSIDHGLSTHLYLYRHSLRSCGFFPPVFQYQT